MFRKASIYIFFIFIILNTIFLYTKEDKNKQKKNLKRAIYECGSLMVISQTNYWLKYTKFIEDWQYELNWDDQSKRLFGLDGQRFDSNNFQVNWTHGLAGAVYYNFARTNGLNLYESTVFTTIASFYWEFIVEWREVISINDNIFTSLGGICIGESFFQLGSYFNCKRGILNKIAGFLTNPPMVLNRWFDRKRNYTYYKPDKKEMNLFFGTFFLMEDKIETPNNRSDFFGFNSSLTYLPEITKKGIIKKKIKGTIQSDFNLKFEITDKGIDEISASTKNIYNGKYKHIIYNYANNYLKGYSFLYSMFSGFDFFNKKGIKGFESKLEQIYIKDSVFVKTPTEFSDKLAIINMIGPYSELHFFFGKGSLIFISSLSLDFGLINAFALNKYSETENISYTKSTLYSFGYHYAFGYTLNSSLSLTYKKFETNLKYKYQNYNSVEGLDRFQDEIRDDFNINDTKSTLKFGMGYKLNILPIGLKLMLEKRHRKGIIKDVSNSKKETRVYVRLDLNM